MTESLGDRAARGSDPEDASRLVTPANLLTISRILLTPLFLVLFMSTGPNWWVLAFGFLIAITDWFDGWLARRHGVTRAGAFLDPLADKVLVLGTLFALVAKGLFPLFPVAVITVRELFISAYRSYWGRRGLSIPARKSAKWKTFIQEISCALALMPPIASDALWMPIVVLWGAMGLTVYSGWLYVRDGSRAMNATGR